MIAAPSRRELDELARSAGMIPIRSIFSALNWGDGWEKAYREERRQHLRDLRELDDKIFWLQHGVDVARFEKALIASSLKLFFAGEISREELDADLAAAGAVL